MNFADALPDDHHRYLPLVSAATRFDLSYHQLYKWYRRGLVKGRPGEGHSVLIDVDSLREWLPPPGWAWLVEAHERYGLTRDELYQLVRRGKVRARKQGLQWQVELASIEAALKEAVVPAGYVTVKEAAQRLGVSGNQVRERIRKGHLRFRRRGRRYLVEESSLEDLAAPGWIGVPEAARRMGLSQTTVCKRLRQGKLRGKKVGGRWKLEEGVCGG